MVSRYGISIGVAIAVTFGLLFLMQLLIASSRATAESAHVAHWIEFVRVERTEAVETRRTKPEKPPEPAEQPELPETTSADPTGAGLTVTIAAPELGDPVRPGGLGLAVSDGEYLPIVKPAPIYPSRARVLGLEGHATVEYTVTAAGATRDIRLVESSNPLFDRSCIDAAEKFKYRPRYVNGEAIEVAGVRNRCTYRLDE